MGRVVEEYRDDKAIFEFAASELRDHLDQQKKMRDVAEQRAAETVSGRERLQHARRAVDELLDARLSQRPLTTGIAEFLSGHWRHHLVQTWLREGPSSAQYLSALSIGEGLMQADADAARAEGGRVADKILELQAPWSLLRELRAGRDRRARFAGQDRQRIGVPEQPRGLHRCRWRKRRPNPTMPRNWGGLRVVGGTESVEHDRRWPRACVACGWTEPSPRSSMGRPRARVAHRPGSALT